MDINITELIGSFAWPAVVVSALFIFKGSISELILKTKSANKDGIKFGDQQEGNAKPTVEASKLPISPSISNPSASTQLAERIDAELKLYKEENKIPILISNLVAARINYASEIIWGLIFGSQIEALKRLDQSGGKASLEEAKIYFDKVKSENGTFYGNVSFEQWFKFIEDHDLAQIVSGSVEITGTGKDFLSFVYAFKRGRDRPF